MKRRTGPLGRKVPLVRRLRLRAGSELRRSAPALRQTPLPAVNPERLERLREQQFGAKAEWIRGLACATCGAPAPSDPSHVRSRGAGGTAEDLIPQCRGCHRRLHDLGRRTFEAEIGVDLGELAERYERWWHEFARLPS